MDHLPLPFHQDHAVFDFSGLPQSPGARGLAVAGRAAEPDPAPDAFAAKPVLRRLLPWIAIQVAAAIGLGTCLAQAMAPVAPKPMPADDMTFALRLGEASAVLGPVPSAIRDGFQLRFSAND